MQQPHVTSDLLTTSLAAQRAKCSEGTIRRLARVGELPSVQLSTGLRLFDPSVIERFARQRGADAV